MKKMAITRLCFMLLALVGMVSCHETGHDGVKHTNESGYGAEQPEHTGVAEDMEGNTPSEESRPATDTVRTTTNNGNSSAAGTGQDEESTNGRKD
jgi:hypothetical protein